MDAEAAPGPLPDTGDASDASGGEGGCGPCSLTNAESTCDGAACAISRCRIGFRDDNGMPADGCEAPDVAPTGLLLWFMADQGVTADAEELVSVWQDQSEGERLAVPPSAAASPHRVALSEQRFALQFDGDDELALPALPAFDSLSFFVVVEVSDGPECPSFLHVSNRAGVNTENEIEIGRHELGALYYEVGSETLRGPRLPPGALQLASIVHSAADMTASMYLDGALVARTAMLLPDAVQRTANYIGFNHWSSVADGNCRPLLGSIAELMLFARGLSDAEREVIQGYLAGKWGLSIAE
jgi:hypothetical protein